MLEHAFAAGLPKVVAQTAPGYAASQNVCLRIGMRYSGQTSEYYNSLCELYVVTAP